MHLLSFLVIYSLLGFYLNWRAYAFFGEGHPRRWKVTLNSCFVISLTTNEANFETTTIPTLRMYTYAPRWLPIISYLARLPALVTAFSSRALLGFVDSKLSRVLSREVLVVQYTFSQAPFLMEMHYGATSERCFGVVPRSSDAKCSSRNQQSGFISIENFKAI